MDSSAQGLKIPHAFQIYAEGPPGRQRLGRMDEIDRLNMWARIAPPFGAGRQANGFPDQVEADENEVLWDDWNFSLCDDACTIREGIVNKTVWQGAPSRISRGGLPLPQVSEDTTTALKPYVVVTRFPNGPIMITTLGRTSTVLGWQEPKSNVTVDLRSVATDLDYGLPALGVFGTYGNLLLILPIQPGTVIKDVRGTDMLTPNDSISLLNVITWHNVTGTLTIPGSVVTSVGRSSGAKVSAAAPGLLLHIVLMQTAPA